MTDGGTVSRGGKEDDPTLSQVAALRRLSKEKDLGPALIGKTIERLGFGTPELGDGNRAAQGVALMAFIQSSLTADQLGRCFTP